MPPTVWIVEFGAWQYKVSVTTTAALEKRYFCKQAIAYHDEESAIAACNARNEVYQRLKQRHLLEQIA